MRLCFTGMAIVSTCPMALKGWHPTPHYENQAFAYGRNALALQFHLEADPRQLEEWYVGHAVELAAAKVSVAELRTATSKRASGLADQANRVFSRWLREIGTYFQPNVKA